MGPNSAVSVRKRSRTGCLTCRRRKKKCDEGMVGSSCQHCRRLGISCQWAEVVKTTRNRGIPLLTTTNLERWQSRTAAEEPSPLGITCVRQEPGLEQVQKNDRLPLLNLGSASSENSMPGKGDQKRLPLEWVKTVINKNSGRGASHTYVNSTSLRPWPISKVTSCPHILTPISTRSALSHEESSSRAVVSLFANNENSTSDPTSEPDDDIYTILSENLLSSIPSTIRHIILSRARSIVRCHKASRTARKAVSSAYRDLLRCRGLEWLRLNAHDSNTIARLISSFAGGLATDLNMGSRVSEMTEFSHIQTALLLLEDPAADLESKMLAIMDMHLYQQARYGAFTANMVLELGDLTLKTGLGSRPALELSKLAIQECFVYRMFAYSDVSRTICQRGRKTAFTLVGLPGCNEDESAIIRKRDGQKPIYSDEYIGLPPDILLCLAAISNLTVDMGSMSTAEVLLKAVDIETRIRTWKPNDALIDLDDDVARMSRMAVREIWRNTALIYFYQSIYGEGPSSENLRDCLASELPLLRGVSSFTGHLACPWFFAGTLAISAQDRIMCRNGLLGCGPEKVWRDDCDALDIIWQERDKTGLAEDWRVVLERTGTYISFF